MVPLGSSRYTRRQIVQRGAAGVGILALPGLLAACGGGGDGGGSDELADVLRFANWPFYIDVDEQTKKRPTLEQFTEETGIRVEYFEEINDNAEYFAKVQGPLSQGQGIDRDIFVFTDNSRFPGLLISEGWVQKLDKELIPNIENLIDAQASPPFDPDREYSLPWQSGMTGIAWNEEQTGPIESIEELVARREMSNAVAEAMKHLPEEQRTAIVLKEYHGLTFQEIADLQGCPLSTVKTRLYQGLSVLRRHLEAQGMTGGRTTEKAS